LPLCNLKYLQNPIATYVHAQVLIVENEGLVLKKPQIYLEPKEHATKIITANGIWCFFLLTFSSIDFALTKKRQIWNNLKGKTQHIRRTLW
jgi:hypothetical protein